jgi:peptidoglycan/LPS O-acetylase OafA/YrhL
VKPKPLLARGGVIHHEFAPLDGYRALAALLVVVTHVWEGLRLVEDNFLLGANFLGYFAVVVFFTMSGFLVYLPFVSRHVAGKTPPVTGRYFWQRLLRIYPLYWVVVSFYFLLSDQNLPDLWGTIRVYGLFQIYSPDTFGRGILPAWTLAVDLSFYVVVPLLALAARSLSRRWGGRQRARLDAELVVITLFFLVGPVWRCAWLVTGAPRLVDIWLPSQTDFFAFGMALALGVAWRRNGGEIPRPVRALASHVPASFGLAVLAFVGIAALGLPIAKINPIEAFVVSPGDQMGRYALYTVAAIGLFVPMVFGTGRSAAARFLGSRPLRAASELSYGVYLWHMLILVHTVEWLGGKGDAGFWPTLYIGLVLSVLASSVTYFAVERPTARLRHLSPRALRSSGAGSGARAATRARAPQPSS